MLRSSHINTELKELNKLTNAEPSNIDNISVLQGVLKAITLLIKVVRDIRTNQVEIMKSQNVELKKDTRSEVKDAKEENK